MANRKSPDKARDYLPRIAVSRETHERLKRLAAIRKQSIKVVIEDLLPWRS